MIEDFPVEPVKALEVGEESDSEEIVVGAPEIHFTGSDWIATTCSPDLRPKPESETSQDQS